MTPQSMPQILKGKLQLDPAGRITDILDVLQPEEFS
jgi:hypothetical protein